MGKCLQYIFLFINFLVFLGGAALTGLSIWLLVDPDSLLELVNNIPVNGEIPEELPETFLEIISAVTSALYFSLTLGILMFLIGFMGCCGAAKKNKCMLNIFGVIMIVLILAEIALAVMAFVYYPTVEAFMQGRIDSYNPTSDQTDDIFNKEFVDQLQNNFKCCGWQSAEDYADNQNQNDLPASCCEGSNTCTSPQFDDGCKDQVQKGIAIIGGVAAGCVLIELIALVSACVIKKKDKEYA
jgi:uncharacterized membrane protein